ncbi:MAG: phosphate ABC transporter permease subunit PstC [Alphaproteobacteria bacterium]|nr:phosphate ABC transporter permease subunit PstC [Alphaproteobacteria bacterium]
MTSVAFLAVFIWAFIGYYSARARALYLVGGVVRDLNSLPRYYGFFVALCILLPGFLFFFLWKSLSSFFLEKRILFFFSDRISDFSSLEVNAFLRNVPGFSDRIQSAGRGPISEKTDLLFDASVLYAHDQWLCNIALVFLTFLVCFLCFMRALHLVTPCMRARARVESFIWWVLACSSAVAVLTSIGILMSLLVQAFRFFSIVPVHEFLFGLHWSPQLSMRPDQFAGSGTFGAVPLFVGTALITVIAMCIATPIGLMSAIYLSDYASLGFRAWAKPVLEILSGIPTVVYGFFAALTVAPLIRYYGELLGLGVAAESALAAGLVMGIMIIPFVSSLSDDVICAVPQSLRDGSAALGATKTETVIKVILPAAFSGIVNALLLAVGRAVGETMIVVMAAGLAPNLTLNPLDVVTTVTVQIMALLSGDQEFDNPGTLAAFALSLVLFFVTFILNLTALRVVRKYRERYD